MIITRLTLENFGVFRGRHVFNLAPVYSEGQARPVILIGGMNGAGKTTIFEAIRLCLYGPNMDELRKKRGAYEKYVTDQIHQILGSPLQLDTAAIEIEFQYSYLGHTDIYIVNRSWHRSHGNLKEILIIKKNGQELNEVETSQWQDFINDLIPPGISRLFFFDGEKIQSLADDSTDSLQLKESFKSLLGLHLVDQLRNDLGIFLARKGKDAGHTELSDQFERLKKEKDEIELQIETHHQSLAQKQAQLAQIQGEIERQELRISYEGGSFAEKRTELKGKRSQIENEIEREKTRIRELCSNLFPFSLTPKYCNKVRERLRQEEQYQRYLSTQSIIAEIQKRIHNEVKSKEFWDTLEVPPDIRQKIIKYIQRIIQENNNFESEFAHFKPVHQLSPIDHQKILTWIDRALHEVPRHMDQASSRLELLTNERRRIESILLKAPEDDVLSPLISDLNLLNQEFGQYSEQIREEEEILRQYQGKLNEINRKINAIQEKLESIDFESTKINYAKTVSLVLEEYSNELQKEKIRELSRIFLECFNRLLRKGKFITDVKIDVEDFSITLYDSGGGIRPKSKLSVGEKQIYAIAMLWALTIASKRPLPFVIDTPLGRLDSMHRGKLVREFFPSASHQMIILSTDTEIDQIYFNQMSPSIARAYHLTFHPSEGMTTITEGYFWDSEKQEAMP